MAIHILKSRVRHDIEDLREVVEMTERNLKTEVTRLEALVDKELKDLSGEEEREFTIGWYADDFVRLDRVFPNIQRRALFTTLMCMTEADLLLACEMCRRAFEIPRRFKKKGNQRVIVQALAYLQENLTIRDRYLKPHWLLVQNLWSIRNALVHNNGKPKPSELESISDFCAPIPTLDLDHHNRIILKEGSVEMALHAVDLFFSRLVDKIERKKLPNKIKGQRPCNTAPSARFTSRVIHAVTTRIKQKESLECNAVSNFIHAYNQTHKKQFTFCSLHKPPMPDAVCILNRREIGIEVVHSYGSSVEAAIRLGNRETSDFPKKKHLKRRTTPINIRALNSINKRLFEKSKKVYSFSPVWLLIRNAFALWGLKEYKQNKNDIYIPESHPFKQIWLLCDENSVGLKGILKLA